MTLNEAKIIVDKAYGDKACNVFGKLDDDETVCLDGWFTADQLEAIAIVMRAALQLSKDKEQQ